MARGGLKTLSRKMPTREEMHEALDHIARESDHTTVILGTALVETALRLAISARTHKDLSSAEDGSLFEGDGPLATFSAKTRLALAFEVINTEMRTELDRLRDIRNAFAHSKSFLTFETEEVRAACATLTMPHYDTGAPWKVEGDRVIWVPDTPRDQFLVSVRMTWVFLYQAIHNPPKWVSA